MDRRLTKEQVQRKERLANRWGFLEEEADAYTVVTRGMEVVYVNAAARALLPPEWFGYRCWELFPVGEENCASRCLAVRAVSHADETVYCEETVCDRDGTPIPLGIAVVPMGTPGEDGEKAVLLHRPKPPRVADKLFRRELLEQAKILRELCD